jgi:HAD superfamily hydrolase (TIGR01509 family)
MHRAVNSLCRTRLHRRRQATNLAVVLIFDCDGVLIDSEAVVVDAEIAFLAAAGLRYDRATYVRRFVGLAPADWHDHLGDDHRRQFGAPPPAGFFAALDDHVHAALEDDLTAIPGAHEAAAAAPRRCVASSTPLPRLHWKLRRTGLADIFGDAVFSADAVADGKPAPDLFLHAADHMGVAPGACTVIEDSVNGVRAGRAAGMHVVGFTGGGHCGPDHADALTAAGAHVVVADFADLHPAVAARGGRLAR